MTIRGRLAAAFLIGRLTGMRLWLHTPRQAGVAFNGDLTKHMLRFKS